MGESQTDIMLTFEELNANKRVTGEEGKLDLFPFIPVMAFHVLSPNNRRLVNRSEDQTL